MLCLQLFRVRLSYEQGKAYAAISKVIWIMVVLRLLDGTSTLLKVFQRMEGNSTNTYIYVFFLPCC